VFATPVFLFGWFMFHGLRDRGGLFLAAAIPRSRSSAGDFLALAGLFAVSVTGLMLTVSTCGSRAASTPSST
jgi:hypothetical protein